MPAGDRHSRRTGLRCERSGQWGLQRTGDKNCMRKQPVYKYSGRPAGQTSLGKQLKGRKAKRRERIHRNRGKRS